MYHIIFNPKSKSGKATKAINKLLLILTEEFDYVNIMEIKDLYAYLNSLNETEKPVFVGGDGTMHFIANALDGRKVKSNIYCYPAGTGNDFFRNIGQKNELLRANDYFLNLPEFEYNNTKEHFLNGLGIGVDGKICEYVNAAHGTGSFSYTWQTIKAFFTFKTFPCKITLDGEEHYFEKCWFATNCRGIYQGGGMMFAPDAKFDDGILDVVVCHSASKFKLLLLFKSIYKGKHLKHTKYVFYKKAKEVIIEPLIPQSIQADGEVRKMITKLKVRDF